MVAIKKDVFKNWINWNAEEICKESNITLETYKDYQENKSLLFEKLQQRFDMATKQYLKNIQEKIGEIK